MRNTNALPIGGVAIALGLALLLAGCATQAPIRYEKTLSMWQNFCQARVDLERQMRENPCGVLKIRQPLLQVSGFLTATPKNNTSLYLFIAPNTSFDAALYVAEHCPPIYRSSQANSKRFALPPLPEGDYVVMLDGRSFGSAQGFPVVNKINDSCWTVALAFHGGNSRYSMAAFSIHPKTNTTAEGGGSCGGRE